MAATNYNEIDPAVIDAALNRTPDYIQELNLLMNPSELKSIDRLGQDQQDDRWIDSTRAKAIRARAKQALGQSNYTQIPLAYDPYQNKIASPKWRSDMAQAYSDSQAGQMAQDIPDATPQSIRDRSQRAYGLSDPSIQNNIQNRNRQYAQAGTLDQQSFSDIRDIKESGMTPDQQVNWVKTRGMPTQDNPQYARLAGDYSNMTDYERTERARMGLGSNQAQPLTRREEYLNRVAGKPLPQRDMRGDTYTSNITGREIPNYAQASNNNMRTAELTNNKLDHAQNQSNYSSGGQESGYVSPYGKMNSANSATTSTTGDKYSKLGSSSNSLQAKKSNNGFF